MVETKQYSAYSMQNVYNDTIILRSRRRLIFDYLFMSFFFVKCISVSQTKPSELLEHFV